MHTPSAGLSGRSASAGVLRGGRAHPFLAVYRFDEATGQQIGDASGNGRHATLGSTAGVDTNDPLWTALGLDFVTDDYATRGSEPDSGLLHVVGVVRVDTLGAVQTLVGRWGASAASCAWLLQIDATGRLVGSASNGSTIAIATTADSVVAGTAIVYELLVDATQVAVRLGGGGVYASAALSGPLNAAGVWALGRNADGGVAYLDGLHAYQVQSGHPLATTALAALYATMQTAVVARGLSLANVLDTLTDESGVYLTDSLGNHLGAA